MEQVQSRIYLLLVVLLFFDGLRRSDQLERCSPAEIITCIQLLEIANVTKSTFTIFTSEELQLICEYEYRDLRSCLDPMRENCDPTLAIGFQAVEDHIEHTCSEEGRKGYLTHAACLNNTQVQANLHECLEIHNERSRTSTGFEGDYQDVMCRLHKEYAMCVRSVGMLSCSHDAGDWLLEKTKSSSNAVSNLLNCPDWTPPPIETTSTSLPESSSEIIPMSSTDAAPSCMVAILAVCISYLERYSPDLVILELLSAAHINDLCSTRLSQFKTCIEPVLRGCSPQTQEDILLLKNTYIMACQDLASPDAREHKICFRRQDVSKQLESCSTIHKTEALKVNDIEKSTSNNDQYWCRITQKYLNCVVDSTWKACGSRSSLWLWQTTVSILQPTAKRLKCVLVYQPQTQPQPQQTLSNNIVIAIAASVLGFCILVVLLVICLLCYCRPVQPHYRKKRRPLSTRPLTYPNLAYLDYSDMDIKSSLSPSLKSQISFITFELP